MNGTPDNTVILHWEEGQAVWTQLPWRDWVRFRGFGRGGSTLLAGAEAGEHYFLLVRGSDLHDNSSRRSAREVWVIKSVTKPPRTAARTAAAFELP